MKFLTKYVDNEFFKVSELTCKVTGIYGLKEDTLHKLIRLRKLWGKPMVITSGYRHYSPIEEESHPIEWQKGKLSGQHALGTALDIKVSNGADAYALMKLAFSEDWSGIALGSGFLHVDNREGIPVSWMY